MNVFIILLGKTLPLYTNILLGYLSARYLKVDRAAIAAVLFYVIGPVVVFHATMSVRIDPAVVFLPVFFYLLSSLIAFLYLRLYQRAWSDATGNILAFAAGTGNTGYFGIALAMVLFEPGVADIYIFTVLASFFYEATTGFYITAKGVFSARDSFVKVIRLPVIYAFIIALVLNLSGIRLPEQISLYTGQFKTVFSILGMMVIGMGLDGLRRGGGFDLKFVGVTLLAKHVFWPVLVGALIVADRLITRILPEEIHLVMYVFSIVPLAGNTVTLAVLLKAQPEKAALAVLVSTLLSIVYIPFMMALYQVI